MANETLANDKFLIKTTEFYSYTYITDAVFMLDLNYQILFAGNGVAKLMARPAKDLLFKNCLEILPISKQSIKPLLATLDKMLYLRQPHEFLSVNPNYQEDLLILHCTEKPIVNPGTNDTVAISMELRKLDIPLYFAKILELNSFPISNLTQDYQDHLLTKREHEIAFLLFHYPTSEKIAEIISSFSPKPVSAKTIRNILSQQLYPKFKVYNIQALIDKLYVLDYHKKIPPSLLVDQYFDLTGI